MRKTLLRVALLLALAIGSVDGKAQQTPHKIIFEQMNYLLYLPDGYDAADSITKWPMMIFLHGASNEGNDLKTMKLEGPPQKIDKGYKFPFIVVSPQSPQNGWRPHHIWNLAESLQKEHNIDAARLYLTGLSMGGFGTWNTAQAYPNYFAAIVPICGGSHHDNAETLEHTPIWCFHGAKDDVVSIDFSQKAMDAIKHFGNKDHKFTIYPEEWHDCWRETYDNPEIYEWMLSHTRYKYKEVPIAPELLQEYAGKYGIEDFEIEVENREDYLTLRSNYHNDQVKYLPMSDNKFFVEGELYQHLEFERDENGKAIAFKIVYPHGASSVKKME